MFRYRATMTVKISTRYEFFFFFSTPCIAEDSIKILKSGHVICFRPFLDGGVYFYTQRCYVDRIFFTLCDKLLVDEERDSNSWRSSGYSYTVFERHFRWPRVSGSMCELGVCTGSMCYLHMIYWIEFRCCYMMIIVYKGFLISDKCFFHNLIYLLRLINDPRIFIIDFYH